MSTVSVSHPELQSPSQSQTKVKTTTPSININILNNSNNNSIHMHFLMTHTAGVSLTDTPTNPLTTKNKTLSKCSFLNLAIAQCNTTIKTTM